MLRMTIAILVLSVMLAGNPLTLRSIGHNLSSHAYADHIKLIVSGSCINDIQAERTIIL